MMKWNIKNKKTEQNRFFKVKNEHSKNVIL